MKIDAFHDKKGRLVAKKPKVDMMKKSYFSDQFF